MWGEPLKYSVRLLYHGKPWQNVESEETWPEKWVGSQLFYKSVTFKAKEAGDYPDRYELLLGDKVMASGAMGEMEGQIRKGDTVNFVPNALVTANK